MTYSKEIDMYPDIIKSISDIMSLYGYKFTVYKTWKTFDQELKDIYPNVVATLNKETLPDLTVIYHNSSGQQKCLIIEVKIGDLIVKDIAQAKMYGDIFNADSVLLVSLKSIRKSFIEFSKINDCFLRCTNRSQLYTCVLQNGVLQTQNCYPPDGGLIRW